MQLKPHWIAKKGPSLMLRELGSFVAGVLIGWLLRRYVVDWTGWIYPEEWLLYLLSSWRVC